MRSLPFTLAGHLFYLKNQYTCSSYISKLLQESGILSNEKHFSLVPLNILWSTGEWSCFYRHYSSVVLMVVATIYKFALVITAVGITVFWHRYLRKALNGFYWLFFFGLFLNVLLVSLLVMVMSIPEIIRRILYQAEAFLVRIKILKKSENRQQQIDQFIDRYAQTVGYLKEHKKS